MNKKQERNKASRKRLMSKKQGGKSKRKTREEIDEQED